MILRKDGKSLLSVNPELAKEWHPTKNGELTPEAITAGSGKKVWWLCERGHEWEAAVGSRTAQGTGCSICNIENRSSFPEQAVCYYLRKVFANVVSSYRIDSSTTTEIDIYIEEINLGIEYDGEAWHKKTERDLRKNLLCKRKGIHLIRIREEKCPSLNDGTFYITVKSNSTTSLENAIKEVFEYINKLRPTKTIDVDIHRDTSDINNLLIHRIKENSLLITSPELSKEFHPIKNGRLTAEMVTANSGRRVWWLGKCGHEWQVSVDSRVHHQSGCPICENRQVLSGFNDLATLYPEIAKEWHPTKNGDLKPTDVGAKISKNIWWICSKGHEYKASLNNRCKPKGTNCPYCANQKLLVGFNDLATVRPDLAREWHPTKNGTLNPSNIVPGYNKKVWWRCEKGHEWEAIVDNRYRGRGCPGCSSRLLITGVNDLTTVNPELAKEWHPTKNGNLKPNMVFPSANKKIWWLDKCGHEYEATANSRNRGRGCPYCSGNKILKGFNDLVTVNPELAKEWHPTKNGDLKPDDATKGSEKKAWWLCPACNHEWETAIRNRNRGAGCPCCKLLK